MADRSNSELSFYMRTVTGATVPLLVVAAIDVLAWPFHSVTAGLWVTIALFSVAVVVGELKPIPISRGVNADDEITVSSTFGFGLLIIAPVFVAIAAQTIGLVIDAVRGRSPLPRTLFNISQYAIAYFAARVVYACVAGQTFTPSTAPHTPVSFAATLLAGAAFILVNNTLVAVAISLNVRSKLTRVLAGDLQWQLCTSAPLIAVGGLAVVAMGWTPWAFTLLLAPIAALHHSGSMLMRREIEARTDSLTGLANRSMLAATAERRLTESVLPTALLLIDLDHFKEINDTLGHAAGDYMLAAVARRLTATVGPKDVVARLGGDEFAVLTTSPHGHDAALALAHRLGKAIRQPVDHDGMALVVGCSIGIAFGPDHASTVSDLLRCADVALYESKTTRDTATIYDHETDEHTTANLALRSDLRAALADPDDGGLWVAFQPQLDTHTGDISGVECLIRWDHPTLGSIAPDVLVPIAESALLIDDLLDYVLHTGLRQADLWNNAGYRPTSGRQVSVSVNLSARQLANPNLPTTIAGLLARYHVQPDQLILEVTETQLMSDLATTTKVLTDLHTAGIQLSIDDFGTGFSSLTQLAHLPVNELKIDKTFVAALDVPTNTAIVASIIDLAHNLGLRVVAEGVETRHAAVQLTAMGCDNLQGHHIGRPAMPSELTDTVLSRDPYRADISTHSSTADCQLTSPPTADRLSA